MEDATLCGTEDVKGSTPEDDDFCSIRPRIFKSVYRLTPDCLVSFRLHFLSLNSFLPPAGVSVVGCQFSPVRGPFIFWSDTSGSCVFQECGSAVLVLCPSREPGKGESWFFREFKGGLVGFLTSRAGWPCQ